MTTPDAAAQPGPDVAAEALARIYQLLLRRAAERRQREQATTSASASTPEADTRPAEPEGAK